MQILSHDNAVLKKKKKKKNPTTNKQNKTKQKLMDFRFRTLFCRFGNDSAARVAVKGLLHPELHLTKVKWSSGCINPFTVAALTPFTVTVAYLPGLWMLTALLKIRDRATVTASRPNTPFWHGASRFPPAVRSLHGRSWGQSVSSQVTCFFLIIPHKAIQLNKYKAH